MVKIGNGSYFVDFISLVLSMPLWCISTVTLVVILWVAFMGMIWLGIILIMRLPIVNSCVDMSNNIRLFFNNWLVLS